MKHDARIKRLGAASGLALAAALWAQPAATEPAPAPAVAPETKPAEAQPQPSQELLPSAAEVFEKHINATGGAKAYAEVKTMVTTGKLKMPAAGVEAMMWTAVAQGRKMESKVEVPGVGSMRAGSDGATVWQLDPVQGPRILEGEERDAMLRSAVISDIAQWQELYTDAACEAREVVNDTPCIRLKAKDKQGQNVTMWFAADSGLLSKTAATMKSPMGEINVEVVPSDYKQAGPLLVPHTMTQSVMGQSVVTTAEKIEIDTPLPAGTFELPAEVKELLAHQKAAPAEKAPEAAPDSSPAPAEPKAPDAQAPAQPTPAPAQPGAH